MDLWVVAAAAGAGYLAKHWKNVFRDKEDFPGFPSGSSAPLNPVCRSSIQEKTDKTCPFGNLSSRKTGDQYLFEKGNENHSDRTLAQTSRTGVTSTSSLDNGKQAEKPEDGNMPSSSIFSPEFGKHENYEYESGYRIGYDMSAIPEDHNWEIGVSVGPRRNRSSLRSKCVPLQFIKPQSAMDSCLVAQMHRGHGEMEDYVLSPLNSPCTPTLRPFLVTDGRRLIGRATRDFRDGIHQESHRKASVGVVGVPFLPQIEATDYPKLKLKSQICQTSNDRKLVQLDSRDDFPCGQYIFCLGVSIGIMYTIIAQKLELEKLTESLKQSENLVQDLQEELEMKDSVTVKELVIDDSSHDAQMDANVLMEYADEDSVNLREDESMSKIEAELEAELERLELSMSRTGLQGKVSDDEELEREFDEDVVAELVHGELKADVLRRNSSSQPTPDLDTSSTSTPLSANYRVSPHELSLRLHNVIESRLQHRIFELEEELTKTRKRVYHLETERVNSWREIWNSESSSSTSTPLIVEAHSPVAQPLVMNLSGDALDAYNEAFEELSNLKGTHKEYFSEGTQVQLDEESPNGDDDDDEDMLLIKQIVEKAKQGSPAILRAQRALVYMGREE